MCQDPFRNSGAGGASGVDAFPAILLFSGNVIERIVTSRQDLYRILRCKSARLKTLNPL